MTIDTSTLEQLASRICHDLISPIGAIHNGLEFMQDMGMDSDEEAMALIAHSSRQASAKLQMFRLAYGAGGNDPHIKPEDVYKNYAAFIEGDGKITQDWDPHADLGFEERPAGYCKMLACALMMASECLPRGGTVTVTAGNPGQTMVVASGTDAGPREKVIDALAGRLSADNLEPRLVHPFIVSILAQHYGYAFTLESNEDAKVTISIEKR
ncbi:MAG: hypothetical protein H6868_05025 [Rhodospirillales bacterium]|nr:hypothetical protein [Rhodospirillales bacterium]